MSDTKIIKELATLRAEVERLNECEEIIREERERILYLKAREWVKKNPAISTNDKRQ